MQKNPCRKSHVGLYNPHKEIYGRRYPTYLQRLRAGIHLQRCRSGVLSRTRLLDPEALQKLPPGKEKRSGGIRLPFGSFTGNSCDLLGLRSAHYRSFRAARRSTGLLPRLLHGAQGQQRRFPRARPRVVYRPVRWPEQTAAGPSAAVDRCVYDEAVQRPSQRHCVSFALRWGLRLPFSNLSSALHTGSLRLSRAAARSGMTSQRRSPALAKTQCGQKRPRSIDWRSRPFLSTRAHEEVFQRHGPPPLVHRIRLEESSAPAPQNAVDACRDYHGNRRFCGAGWVFPSL